MRVVSALIAPSQLRMTVNKSQLTLVDSHQNLNRFSDEVKVDSDEAKHSNRSCYANLQLSRTIKTIVNLHSMTCCYASPLKVDESQRARVADLVLFHSSLIRV